MKPEILFEYNPKSNINIQIIQGDITSEKVDAIVNAANKYLQHGGGVAEAISLTGGSIIQEESDTWIEEYGAISHEEPAFTSAGLITCNYIIHAVGPIWGEGDEPLKLLGIILSSLKLAEKLNVKSISFPAISTGIYGYPLEKAAQVFFGAFEKYFTDNEDSEISLLRLVLYNSKSLDVFLRVFKERVV